MKQRAWTFHPVSVFAILLVVAIAYSLSACTPAKNTAQMTAGKNKNQIDPKSAKVAVRTSTNEGQFVFQNTGALRLAHDIFTESLMFLVREVPSCKLPENERVQDRHQKINWSVLKEVAEIMESHWDVGTSTYLPIVSTEKYRRTSLEYTFDKSNNVQGLLIRGTGGLIIAHATQKEAGQVVWVFDHTQFSSSSGVSLLPTEKMTCVLTLLSVEGKLARMVCANLGQVVSRDTHVETVILRKLEYVRSAPSDRKDYPLLQGEGSQYRDGKPLCEDDKAIPFAAPRDQQFIEIFLRHERALTPPPPPPPPVPVPQSAPVKPVPGKKVSAELEGDEAPQNPGVEAILMQESEVRAEMNNDLIHRKVDPEPGATKFADPRDLNGVAE